MPNIKKNKEKIPDDKELNEFEIIINEFGQIITNFKIDKINTFLDKNVADKKLKNRDST